MLISPAMEWDTLFASRFNSLGAAIRFPSFAAAARRHGRCGAARKGESLDDFLLRAEQTALTEYLPATAASGMTPAQDEQLLELSSHWLGLSVEQLARHSAMPPIDGFVRDLLRDEGRVDDALRLFRDGKEGEWTPALRRQLLEICRETGREEVLISQFRKLMAEEPDNLEWRSGLSRHFLENGDRDQAKAVGDDFGKQDTSPDRQLEAAYALMDLGLDDLALAAANTAAKTERLAETSQLFIVKLFVDRGRFAEATKALDRLEGREREVIARRFGLEGEKPQTLEQIGTRMNLSRERIRQIEKEALGHMKQIPGLQEVYEDLGKASFNGYTSKN